MKIFLPLILVPLALQACATMDDQIAHYNTLSCYDLAREIGRYEDQLSEAKIESVAATIGEIVSEGDDETSAQIDGAVADWEIDDAREHLSALKNIRRNKGCSF